MMGECDDESRPRTFQYDDIKWKTLEAKTLYAARSGRQGYFLKGTRPSSRKLGAASIAR
jgi:hypothetical protein